jgi:hypothetical protein
VSAADELDTPSPLVVIGGVAADDPGAGARMDIMRGYLPPVGRPYSDTPGGDQGKLAPTGSGVPLTTFPVGVKFNADFTGATLQTPNLSQSSTSSPSTVNPEVPPILPPPGLPPSDSPVPFGLGLGNIAGGLTLDGMPTGDVSSSGPGASGGSGASGPFGLTLGGFAGKLSLSGEATSTTQSSESSETSTSESSSSESSEEETPESAPSDPEGLPNPEGGGPEGPAGLPNPEGGGPEGPAGLPNPEGGGPGGPAGLMSERSSAGWLGRLAAGAQSIAQMSGTRGF